MLGRDREKKRAEQKPVKKPENVSGKERLVNRIDPDLVETVIVPAEEDVPEEQVEVPVEEVRSPVTRRSRREKPRIEDLPKQGTEPDAPAAVEAEQKSAATSTRAKKHVTFSNLPTVSVDDEATSAASEKAMSKLDVVAAVAATVAVDTFQPMPESDTGNQKQVEADVIPEARKEDPGDAIVLENRKSARIRKQKTTEAPQPLPEPDLQPEVAEPTASAPAEVVEEAIETEPEVGVSEEVAEVVKDTAPSEQVADDRGNASDVEMPSDDELEEEDDDDDDDEEFSDFECILDIDEDSDGLLIPLENGWVCEKNWSSRTGTYSTHFW